MSPHHDTGYHDPGLLGAVLVWPDDPTAPAGCSALRVLGGSTLQARAQAALAAAPEVTRLITVERGSRTQALAAVLADAFTYGEESLIALHEPRSALVGPSAVRILLAALLARPDAVAAVGTHPVTDTLKRLDPDGDVLATLDRTQFQVVLTPLLVRRDFLAKVVTAEGPLVAALAGLGPVLTVELAGDAVPIGSDEALALAEAALPS